MSHARQNVIFETAQFDWLYHYSGRCTANVTKGHQTLDQRARGPIQGSGHARLDMDMNKGLQPTTNYLSFCLYIHTLILILMKLPPS